MRVATRGTPWLLVALTLAFPAAPGAAGQIRLRDVAAESGLHFELHSGPTPAKPMVEAVAGGVAAFDADSDGLTDIYFTNGADPRSLRKEHTGQWNRLYRNLGQMRFADVTQGAAVAGHGYSMGAAAADYDNDGDRDLFVAGYRANILFRNDGGGKFSDVTGAAGIGASRWSVAAAWLDYDRDGFLDLFVVNYLDWDLADDRYCGDRERGLRIYCSPAYYPGLPNELYRNRGDGTFEDVSRASGVDQHVGKGMSAAVGDFDVDGWVDIFVANDTEPDFLFRNSATGAFEEVGLLAGVALASDGVPISSMGVAFQDVDNDGLPDIHVTALNRQTFPLFRNAGDGLFADVTATSGLQRLTVSRSGWSNLLVDLDNDGLKDLFVATSHVNDLAGEFENARYRQANAVFRNMGSGSFEDVSGQAARFEPSPHRGAAAADFDLDGRVDLVVSSIGGPAELWKNETPGDNHWLGIRLIGNSSNRDGTGARVRVGDQVVTASSSAGYASSSLEHLHFGLGPAPEIREISVTWPAGSAQSARVDVWDQVITVAEPAP